MKEKGILIAMLCTVIVVMAVAFAAFQTTLTINGTASIESNWCVRIKDNPTCTKTPVTGGASSSVTASVTKVSATTATISMGFTQPGDSATCTIVFENCGSVNAKLNNLLITGNDEKGAIRFTVTGLTKDATLTKETGTHTAVVTGKYDTSVTTQPTDAEKSKSLTITAEYVQNF